MDRNKPLQNNFNNTDFIDYTQNNFNSNIDHVQPPQYDYPGYYLATDDNSTSVSYTTDNNYRQQLEQRPEQSLFSFTNNGTQLLSNMPQHQQNSSLPLNSFNTMVVDPSQANNSESVFNFEIPGFRIKIIVTPTSPTSFPFANSNQFQHTYSND